MLPPAYRRLLIAVVLAFLCLIVLNRALGSSSTLEDHTATPADAADSTARLASVYSDKALPVAHTSSAASSLISPQVITTVQLPPGIGYYPHRIATQPKTGYTYVGSDDERVAVGQVAVISGTQVIASLAAGSGPIRMDEANGYVYVGNADGIAVLSGTQMIEQISLGTWSSDIGVNSSTHYIYVAQADNDKVIVLSDTQEIAIIPVGDGPNTIGVNPVSGYVYVANAGSKTVTVLSGTAVLATLTGSANEYTNIRAIKTNPQTGYVYLLGLDAVSVVSGTELLARIDVGVQLDDLDINPVTGYIYVPAMDGSVTVLSNTQVVTTLMSQDDYLSSVAANPVTGYVYVIAPNGNHIIIISATHIITTLTVTGMTSMVGVNPLTGYVYVGNYEMHGVSILSGLQVVTTLGPGSAPIAAALNPTTGYLYVLNDSGAVNVLSGTQVIATLFTRGEWPVLGLNPNTGYLYVGNWGSDDITIISGTQIVTRVPVGGHPVGIAVNPRTGYAYVAGAWASSVTVLSGTQVVTTIGLPGGSGSYRIAANPATGYIYVVYYYVDDTGQPTSGIGVLSGTTYVGTLDTGSVDDFAVNPTNGDVYAVISYEVNGIRFYYVQPISGTTLLARINIDVSPTSVDVNATTGYVYAAGGNVAVVSGTQQIATVPMRCGGKSIGINSTSGYVYVANYYSNDVVVISQTTVVADLAVGAAPRSITVDPVKRRAYVLNYGDRSVSYIQEEFLTPRLLTPVILDTADREITFDFGQPMVTSTIQFEIAPAVPLTAAWNLSLDQVTLTHVPFQAGVFYALQLLPNGKAGSGVQVWEREFKFVFQPFQRLLVPVVAAPVCIR